MVRRLPPQFTRVFEQSLGDERVPVLPRGDGRRLFAAAADVEPGEQVAECRDFVLVLGDQRDHDRVVHLQVGWGGDCFSGLADFLTILGDGRAIRDR